MSRERQPMHSAAFRRRSHQHNALYPNYKYTGPLQSTVGWIRRPGNGAREQRGSSTRHGGWCCEEESRE